MVTVDTQGNQSLGYLGGISTFDTQRNIVLAVEGVGMAEKSEADRYVAAARSMLNGFEDESVEVKHGAVKHAIDELENARRALPDDY